LDQGENTWHIELKLDHCRTCHNLELGCRENYSSQQIHEAEKLLWKTQNHYICCVCKASFVYILWKIEGWPYKDIEGSSFEMVRIRRLSLSRNIDKLRHFDIIHIINDIFLHHLQNSDKMCLVYSAHGGNLAHI